MKNNKVNTNFIESEKQDAILVLAAGIAHEFNNLISGINGYLEILEDYISDDGKKFINKIFSCIDKFESLIDQLLNLTKPEKSYNSNFSPYEIIQEIISFLNYKIKENKIKIILLDDYKKNINSDKQKFYHIILNLILNAIDAVSQIENPQITIKLFFNNNNLNINFYDNGKGIEKENIKNIFLPFFSTKTNNSTGIGLALVYKYINNLNGKIQVHSQINSGTEFKLTIPISPKITKNPILEIDNSINDKILISFSDIDNPNNATIIDYFNETKFIIEHKFNSNKFYDYVFINIKSYNKNIKNIKCKEKIFYGDIEDIINNYKKILESENYFYYIIKPFLFSELNILKQSMIKQKKHNMDFEFQKLK